MFQGKRKHPTQQWSKPAREGDLVDRCFMNRKRLAGDGMVGGCLEHSDHEMVEFFGSLRRKDGSQQNCHLGFHESRLWPVKEPG